MSHLVEREEPNIGIEKLSIFFGSATIMRFLFQSIRIPHDTFDESEFRKK